jgi:hypothetical protein
MSRPPVRRSSEKAGDMDFVKFKVFYSTLKAEMLGNLLEAQGVGVQLKTSEAIFGQAGSPLGTALWVPQDKVPFAHELLDGLISGGEYAREDLDDDESPDAPVDG